MPTDDERRRVAARLRACAGDEYIEIEPLCEAIGCDARRGSGEGIVWNRLADLIEPSCDRDTPQKVAEEMFGKMRHSTKEEADAYGAVLESKSVEIHPVDRDALLALADEMEERAGLVGYARRIREALGVEL